MLSLLLDTYHKTYLAIRNILPTVMTPDSLWAKQNGLGEHYVCVYVHKQRKSTDITVIRGNITHVYLCHDASDEPHIYSVGMAEQCLLQPEIKSSNSHVVR